MLDLLFPASFHSSNETLKPPTATVYIDEGYSMIRTEAPKDFGGRLWRNCARTTPELPGDKELAINTLDLECSKGLSIARLAYRVTS